MKKIILFSFFLSCVTVMSNASFLSLPAMKPQSVWGALRLKLQNEPGYKFESLSINKIEQLLNKKLTFKEKVSLKIFQATHKTKPVETNDNSKTAIVLSILGLATLWFPIASIPFAIGGIVFSSKALKLNSEDRKAKTAMALSLLSLGITLVGGLIYAIFVSNSPFNIFIF
ncbi:MAG: hypothetical protein EPO57_08255 [Chitinophagaceae bacterium]|nr:MAG: hypothetical protein EPO57_08255 [Chitinophagaceae bacterium]